MNTLKPATWMALVLALTSIIAQAWISQTPESRTHEPLQLACSDGGSGNGCGGGPG